MTRKELLNLEVVDFREEIPLLHELYFIPTMRKHDSGYRQIEVIGIRYKVHDKRYCYGPEIEFARKVATFSDVIHWNMMRKTNNQCWSIDVPSDCNCMRLFASGPLPRIKILFNLSDFEFEVVE